MFRFILCVLIFLTTPSAVCGEESAAIDVRWLFNPVGQSVLIEVRPPAEVQEKRLTLALMDHAGLLLAPSRAVVPGELDLAALLPQIWKLRRASYLQLIADDEPIGSAMVLQPMLSRLVPITEEAVNPNGIRYTRIVNWRDETADDADADRAADEHAVMPPKSERLFTGLRIYPERDVLLRLNEGDIRLALRPDHAPNTVWNFLQLCEGGFYRGVSFHRVVPFTRDGDPFVIQAGDPTGSGSGGPGYWLPIEKSELAHDFGVISMARDVDPDSAGSQFFICLSRAGTARLDGHYCAFGETVKGAETIEAVASTELADFATGRPVNPPTIGAVVMLAAPPRTPLEGRPDQRVKPNATDEEAKPSDGDNVKPERVPR